jgi:hypothetical protein
MAVLDVTKPAASTEPKAGAPRLSLRLLCFFLLLYIPVQWVVGRHPGSTSIFSSQHRQLRQEFQDMHVALRQQIIFECTQRGVHDIYFSAADVASPYFANQAPPGCQLHRPTDVTPVEPDRELACSAVIVDESLPDAWNPVRHWEMLGPMEEKLVQVSEWESETRQFGFQLLQARGCPQAGKTAER